MENNNKIIDFWTRFIESNPKYAQHSIPQLDSYCNDPISTNQLADLVNKSIKTASCSAFIDYKISNEELPKVGELKIIVDWDHNPICIIKITKVYLQKFNEIDESFALKEGEGDKSLAYWQVAHKNFFTKILNEYNLSFSENLLLVCEEFEKIN